MIASVGGVAVSTNTQVDALLDVLARINEVLNLESVLLAVIEGTRRLLGTDWAVIYQRGESGEYVCPVLAGVSVDCLHEACHACSVAAVCQRAGMPPPPPFITAILEKEPQAAVVLNHPSDHVELALVMPVARRGQVMGHLVVQHHAPFEYRPEHLRMVEVLATQAGVAIENARLYQASSLREKELRSLADSILEAVGEGICVLDAQGRTVFANPAAEHMVGYAQSDVAGQRLHDLIHGSRLDGSAYPWDECPVRVTLDNGAVRHVTGDTFWRRDGTSFPVEYISTPIVEDGHTVGAVFAFMDITQRRQIEEERERLLAREQAARARAERVAAEQVVVLRHIADGVVIADASGRITFANEAARKHFGVGDSTAMSESLRRGIDVLAAQDQSCQVPELPLATAIARDETIVGMPLCVQQPSGEWINVLGSATPIVTENGAKLGAVMTLHDVTAQRTLERQKDEFLGNISHDLRTPLAAIMTSIGVVLANEPAHTPAPLHRMLVNIELAADRLAEIVDNLLELTRLEAGRMQLQPERLDLRTLVERCARTIEPIVQAQGQRLEVEMPLEPVHAVVDANRVERAVLNLLSNAHKYGRLDGTIRISLAQGPAQAIIAVADDGPGILKGEQERIFERFYQSAGDTGLRKRGSGLGLHIARAMVELHGGRLWLESEPGAGATFCIALPIEQASGTEIEAIQANQGSSASVTPRRGPGSAWRGPRPS